MSQFIQISQSPLEKELIACLIKDEKHKLYGIGGISRSGGGFKYNKNID